MPLNNNDSLIGKYKNIDVFMSSKPISFIDMKIYQPDGDINSFSNRLKFSAQVIHFHLRQVKV
jgi:hypothetical protein